MKKIKTWKFFIVTVFFNFSQLWLTWKNALRTYLLVRTLWFCHLFNFLTLKALRVISLLYKTQWSRELRTWSRKMNLTDTSTNSFHNFNWKRIGTTNENLNFDKGQCSSSLHNTFSLLSVTYCAMFNLFLNILFLFFHYKPIYLWIQLSMKLISCPKFFILHILIAFTHEYILSLSRIIPSSSRAFCRPVIR